MESCWADVTEQPKARRRVERSVEESRVRDLETRMGGPKGIHLVCWMESVMVLETGATMLPYSCKSNRIPLHC